MDKYLQSGDSNRAAESGRASDQHVTPELSDLAGELAEIVKLLSETIEVRAKAVQRAAVDAGRAGLDTTAGLIRSHPLEAMVVATLLGSGLAILLTSGGNDDRNSKRDFPWPGAWDNVGERVTRVAKEGSSVVLPALERVAEALSNLGSTVPGPVDRLTQIWRSLRASATG